MEVEPRQRQEGQGIRMSRDALLHMSWFMTTFELVQLCRTEFSLRRACGNYIYPRRFDQLWTSDTEDMATELQKTEQRTTLNTWHQERARMLQATTNPLWRLYWYHIFKLYRGESPALGISYPLVLKTEHGHRKGYVSITVYKEQRKRWTPKGDPYGFEYKLEVFASESILRDIAKNALRRVLGYGEPAGAFRTMYTLFGLFSKIDKQGKIQLMGFMDILIPLFRLGFEPVWRKGSNYARASWMVSAPEIPAARIPSDPRLQAPICFSCGGEAVKQCSGCKDTYYCSKECCVRGWRELGHSLECGTSERKGKGDEITEGVTI